MLKWFLFIGLFCKPEDIVDIAGKTDGVAGRIHRIVRLHLWRTESNIRDGHWIIQTITQKSVGTDSDNNNYQLATVAFTHTDAKLERGLKFYILRFNRVGELDFIKASTGQTRAQFIARAKTIAKAKLVAEGILDKIKSVKISKVYGSHGKGYEIPHGDELKVFVMVTTHNNVTWTYVVTFDTKTGVGLIGKN